MRRQGFTLLEVMIALAILGMSLMAIFRLNAGAVAMHAYTKRLTVASMLARGKMVDLEQELYQEGFEVDDQEVSGDFKEEGWNAFQWRARIIMPDTSETSPEQFMGALFNLPIGGSSDDPLAGLAGMLGGGAAGAEGATNPNLPPGATQGLSPLAGIASGLLTTQFTQMMGQISEQVREIHLTVSWKDGTQVESLDLVTHVVQQGTGGDRNGASGAGGIPPGLPGGTPNLPGGGPGPGTGPGTAPGRSPTPGSVR